MRIAFPLAAHLEGENVESLFTQEFTIGHARPAIRAEFQAEDNHSLARAGGGQITAAQCQIMGRREVNCLGIGDGLAEGNDEQGFFLKDAHHVGQVGANDVDMDQEQEHCKQEHAQAKPLPQHGCHSKAIQMPEAQARTSLAGPRDLVYG